MSDSNVEKDAEAVIDWLREHGPEILPEVVRIVALAREAEGLRTNIVATLEMEGVSAVRVREGGRSEGIAVSLAVTMAKMVEERDLAVRAKEEFSAHAVRAATERNEALRAKEAAEAEIENTADQLNAQLDAERNGLKKAEARVDALRKYVNHEEDCIAYRWSRQTRFDMYATSPEPGCTCGLKAALAGDGSDNDDRVKFVPWRGEPEGDLFP